MRLLSASIVLAAIILGLMNRYEHHPDKYGVWVTDRLTGEVTICNGTKCAARQD